MATYTLGSGDVAAHNKALTANTVDTVNFADDVDYLEVYSSGSAAVYFTVDGSTPAVEGQTTYHLPALPSSREVRAPAAGQTVVKLKSTGTPSYHVTKVS